MPLMLAKMHCKHLKLKLTHGTLLRMLTISSQMPSNLLLWLLVPLLPHWILQVTPLNPPRTLPYTPKELMKLINLHNNQQIIHKIPNWLQRIRPLKLLFMRRMPQTQQIMQLILRTLQIMLLMHQKMLRLTLPIQPIMLECMLITQLILQIMPLDTRILPSKVPNHQWTPFKRFWMLLNWLSRTLNKQEFQL